MTAADATGLEIGDWRVAETVTPEPTLENVAALGLLVVVRTFLAWSSMVELHGRRPWQRAVPVGSGGAGAE